MILATDYLNVQTSRVLVFSVDGAFTPVVIDKVRLAALLTEDQRAHFTGNDHVLVEASALQGDKADSPRLGTRCS